MLTRIVIAFLFLVAMKASAQSLKKESENGIDRKVKECLDKPEGQTTVGMIECENLAAEEWDKELNKYYKLLLNKLNPDEQQKLKNAQRKWLEYRDTEFEFSGTMHINMEGTMWRIVAASRRTEIIKERALDLKSYYDTLTFDEE